MGERARGGNTGAQSLHHAVDSIGSGRLLFGTAGTTQVRSVSDGMEHGHTTVRGREGGREGSTEGWMDGWMDGGREGGREGMEASRVCVCV